MTHSFNIINWKLAEIRWMDHLRADIECLYIKRENGGGWLIQLELTYKTTTIGLKITYTKQQIGCYS